MGQDDKTFLYINYFIGFIYINYFIGFIYINYFIGFLYINYFIGFLLTKSDKNLFFAEFVDIF